MNKSSPRDLQRLARQWGATAVPFTELTDKAWIQNPSIERAWRLLDQTAALRGLMLLDGPNGTGKSVLAGRWSRQLDARLYPALAITQATLSGSSLLSCLGAKLGKPPSCRRETSLRRIERALEELGRQTLALILDEAQNYSPSALEEIRLLLGLNLGGRPAFALVLIGDEYLLGSLRLRHHRALLSRLSAHHTLRPWDPDQSRKFLETGLEAAAIDPSALEEGALELIVRAGAGTARTLALLGRGAWIEAGRAGSQTIGLEHAQKALEQIPSAAGAPAPGLEQAD